MSEQQMQNAMEANQAAVAEQASAEVTNDAENVTDSEFTLQDVTRRYFSPSELDEASEYMNAVSQVCPDGALKSNFDGSSVPDGFGIAVDPIKKRVENEGNVTVGVAVCVMPDMETIAEYGDGKGLEFIKDAVNDKLMAKIAHSFRPRNNETQADRVKREASVPTTIEAFLTSARGDGSLKTFTQLSSDFVKALRKMGLSLMSSAILRQTLSSKEFATAQYPKIPDASWDAILDKMISNAKAEKLDPAILVHWKETRADRPYEEITDLDMEELNALV